MTSQWQRILYAAPVPDRRRQIDMPHLVPVRVPIVWELDGEETLPAHAIAWTRRPDLVLVHLDGHEPRSQTLGAWVSASDVKRL